PDEQEAASGGTDELAEPVSVGVEGAPPDARGAVELQWCRERPVGGEAHGDRRVGGVEGVEHEVARGVEQGKRIGAAAAEPDVLIDEEPTGFEPGKAPLERLADGG